MFDFDRVGTVAFFRERHRVEYATTARLLRNFPPEMLDYRPHPASSKAGSTAWTIVRGLMICNQLITRGIAKIPVDPVPTYQVLLAEYDRQAQALQTSLLGFTQELWDKDRQVLAGERTLLDQPLGQSLWLFHFDGIHHRGQLSTYLRPLGAKVPSIYGPSGDCPA